jgi:hypothetical protein
MTVSRRAFDQKTWNQYFSTKKVLNLSEKLGRKKKKLNEIKEFLYLTARIHRQCGLAILLSDAIFKKKSLSQIAIASD